MRERLGVIGAMALAALVLTIGVRFAAGAHFAMGDFRAFYCAGAAVLDHRDPYDASVMGSCEAMPLTLSAFFAAKHGEVLPAPVPGYVAAFLALLAMLPFPLAALLFAAGAIGALGQSCRMFSSLGIAPLATIIVAIAILACDVSLPVGELPPFAFFGLALLALGIRRNRRILVAIGTALTLIEPQAGIAVVIVLIVTRTFAIEAIATCAALAIVSVAAIGLPANIEYVRSVLPEHVLSELPSIHQYTISWAFSMVGAPDRIAIGVARLTYGGALLLVAALSTGARARKRIDVAILLAPAAVLPFGPFLHVDHMLLAVPAAFVFAKRIAQPWLATALLCALVLPIVPMFVSPLLIALALIVAAALALWRYRAMMPALVTCGAVLAYVLICALAVVHTGLHLASSAPTPVLHPSQHAWAAYVRRNWDASAWPLWLIKTPPWLALAGIFLLYCRRYGSPLGIWSRTAGVSKASG